MAPQNNLLTDDATFTRYAMNLIDHTLYGRIDAARDAERMMIANLAIQLLNRERADPGNANSDILSFFGFCHRNIARSHAQILQDLWVLYMLAERQDGYFVEFGACDGKLLSNTMLLEEAYRWQGILAEPNRHWHGELRANRRAIISHKCVAASSGDEIEFMATDKRPELSRVASIVPDDVHERNGNRAEYSLYKVETTSLVDLLKAHDAPEVIDYLSIDTEGSEYDILRAFDFDSYRFRLITVEHAGEKEKREQIRELLEAKGYNRWLPILTRWDDWYIGEV